MDFSQGKWLPASILLQRIAVGSGLRRALLGYELALFDPSPV